MVNHLIFGMDISTINTIIGVSITLIGSAMLFIAGAILTYVRSINRKLETVLMATVKHSEIIENHGHQLKDIWLEIDHINKRAETHMDVLLNPHKP